MLEGEDEEGVTGAVLGGEEEEGVTGTMLGEEEEEGVKPWWREKTRRG